MDGKPHVNYTPKLGIPVKVLATSVSDRHENDSSGGGEVKQRFTDDAGVSSKNWGWFLIAQPTLFNTLLISAIPLGYLGKVQYMPKGHIIQL